MIEYKSPILLPAGGLKVTGGAKGDLQVGTGSTNYAALGVGLDGQGMWADASESAGVRWGFDFWESLLIAPKLRHFQLLSAASGDTDIGAPPSGTRWMIAGVYVYNPTAGSIVFSTKFRRSGTTSRLTTNVTATTLGTKILAIKSGFLLESSDTLIATTNASGLTIMVSVVEYSTLSPVKSVLLTSLASGNNTIYTCPANRTACNFQIEAVGMFNPIGLNGLSYRNSSGGSRNVYFNLVKSGGSVVAPGAGSNAFQEVAAVPNNQEYAQDTSAGIFLEAGDYLNINTNASTATQLAWVNLIELPVP